MSFLKQARPFGLIQSLKAVADNNLNVSAGPSLKSDMPNNFVTSCMWQLESYKQYSLAAAFAAAWLAETKDPVVNPYAANSHTAVMSCAGALKVAPGGDTAGLIAALETITFDSVYGPLGYRREDHQLKVDPGYMELGPQAADPGWRMVKFVRVPFGEASEPPTPGKAFAL